MSNRDAQSSLSDRARCAATYFVEATTGLLPSRDGTTAKPKPPGRRRRSLQRRRDRRLAQIAVIGLSLGGLLTNGARGDDFARGAGYYQSRQWTSAIVVFEQLLKDLHNADHQQRKVSTPSPDASIVPSDGNEGAIGKPDSGPAEIRFFLAESYLQAGDMTSAARHYELFLRKHQDHEYAPRALFRWGESLFLNGETTTAAQLLRKFNRVYGNHDLNAFALVYLGLIEQAKDPSVARRRYEDSLQKYPSGPMAKRALLALTELAHASGDGDRMLAHLKDYRELRLKRRERGNDAKDVASEAAEDAKWHYWHGLAQHDRGRLSEALADFELAIRLSPDFDLIRDATFRSARAYWDAGQLEAAVERYAKVVERWPASEQAGGALLALAQLSINAEEFVEAQTHLDQFARSHAQDSRRHVADRLRGALQLRRGNFEEAIQILDDLAHDPTAERSSAERALTWYYLAQSYHGDGQVKRAWDVLHRIRRAQVTSALAARIDYAEASLLLDLGRPEDALVTLEQALSAAPTGPFAERVLWKRVQVLIKLGRIHDALDIFRGWTVPTGKGLWFYRHSAIELAEAAFAAGEVSASLEVYNGCMPFVTPADRPQIMMGAAWCHLRLGNYPQATRLLERLIQERPGDPRLTGLTLALGNAQDAAGQRLEAERSFRRLAETDSKHPDRWKATVRLAGLLQSRGESLLAIRELSDGFANAKKQAAGLASLDLLQYNLAWTLREAKRNPEAFEQFLQIHARASMNQYWCDATYRIGEFEFERGQMDRAECLLSEVLDQLQSDRQTPLRQYVLYLKARIFAERDEWRAAEFLLVETLAITEDARLRTAAEKLLSKARDSKTRRRQAAPSATVLEPPPASSTVHVRSAASDPALTDRQLPDPDEADSGEPPSLKPLFLVPANESSSAPLDGAESPADQPMTQDAGSSRPSGSVASPTTTFPASSKRVPPPASSPPPSKLRASGVPKTNSDPTAVFGFEMPIDDEPGGP